MSIFRSLINQGLQVSGSAVYDDTLDMVWAETYFSESLERDLNYLRTQTRLITGETNWFNPPVNTLKGLNTGQIGMSGSFQNIYTFVGMNDRNDTSPNYYTNHYVVNGTSLEMAIGALDAHLHSLSGSIGIPTLQTVTDAGAITTNAIHVNASGSTFSTLTVINDLQVGSNIILGGTVDGVDLSVWNTAIKAYTGETSNTDSSPSYTSQVYITDGDSLVAAVGKLDAAINNNNVDIVKVSERLTTKVDAGTSHILPGGNSYTLDNGDNMDVYFNGVMQQCASAGGEVRDYSETDTTHVTFNYNLPKDSYITYVIRK